MCIHRLRSKSVLGYLLGCNTNYCFACTLFIYFFHWRQIEYWRRRRYGVSLVPWRQIELGMHFFKKNFQYFLSWRQYHHGDVYTKYTHLCWCCRSPKTSLRAANLYSVRDLLAVSLFANRGLSGVMRVVVLLSVLETDSCAVSLPLSCFRSRKTPAVRGWSLVSIVSLLGMADGPQAL